MIEVIVPQWGLTMDEATVVKWLKAVGEGVTEGEPIAEIETDKADSELESPGTGLLAEIIVEAGSIVKPGEVIALIASE